MSEPLSIKSNSRIGASGYFVCAQMTEAWCLGNKTQKHVPKPEKNFISKIQSIICDKN